MRYKYTSLLKRALHPQRRKIWHSRLAMRREAKKRLLMINQVIIKLMIKSCSYGEKNYQDAQKAK
jgi:hypothetical protein